MTTAGVSAGGCWGSVCCGVGGGGGGEGSWALVGAHILARRKAANREMWVCAVIRGLSRNVCFDFPVDREDTPNPVSMQSTSQVPQVPVPFTPTGSGHL